MKQLLAIALDEYHRTRAEFLRLCAEHRSADYDEQDILRPQIDAALDRWVAAQRRFERAYATHVGVTPPL